MRFDILRFQKILILALQVRIGLVLSELDHFLSGLDRIDETTGLSYFGSVCKK